MSQRIQDYVMWCNSPKNVIICNLIIYHMCKTKIVPWKNYENLMFTDTQNVFCFMIHMNIIHCNCKHKFSCKMYKCFAKPYDSNINTNLCKFLLGHKLGLCFELNYLFIYIYIYIYMFNELELSACTCWKSAMHAGRKSHSETRAHSTVPAGHCLQ